MRLPEAPERWSREFQNRLSEEITKALQQRRERGDLVLERTAISGATRQERLILSSPNGTRYAIKVSDAGVLSTEAA